MKVNAQGVLEISGKKDILEGFNLVEHKSGEVEIIPVGKDTHYELSATIRGTVDELAKLAEAILNLQQDKQIGA